MNSVVRSILIGGLRLVGVRNRRLRVNGHRVRVPIEALSLRTILLNPEQNYEGDFENAVRGLCKPGMVIFDVGANIGLFTHSFVHAVGPVGRVVAFEANPSTAETLRRVAALNGWMQVEVVAAAAGESGGVIEFSVSGPSAEQRVYGIGNGEVVSVPEIPLDKYIADSGRIPDLVKIDVEGYELHVLRGLRETMKSRHPIIAIEIHPRRMEPLGHRVEQIEEFFASIGYRMRSEFVGPAARADRGRPFHRIYEFAG
jgi:FkbM family methyltransferase